MKIRNLLGMLTLLLLMASCSYGEVPLGQSKATFVVHCYTVGQQALRGHPGVISVTPGWSGPREVDRVVFDPEKITVEQMEESLRRAGTYRETIEVIHPRRETEEMKD